MCCAVWVLRKYIQFNGHPGVSLIWIKGHVIRSQGQDGEEDTPYEDHILSTKAQRHFPDYYYNDIKCIKEFNVFGLEEDLAPGNWLHQSSGPQSTLIINEWEYDGPARTHAHAYARLVDGVDGVDGARNESTTEVLLIVHK